MSIRGNWRDVGTVEGYWKAHMDLLDSDNDLNLHDYSWPIFSKTPNLPPHHILKEAKVRNTWINEGSMVFGEIYDSIIGHRCVIQERSIVEKSVILTSAQIEHDCHISYAVIGDEVVIPAHTEIHGDETNIILVTNDNLEEILEHQGRGEDHENKALCVIDGTNTSQSLQNLLNQRCVAALPFAGRYRLVDFALSNAVHSGLTNVSIFPDGDYHSLSDHIRSGKFWGLDRKVDGLFLLPPKKVSAIANTLTFARMREYIEYFLRSRQKYVVLYHANIITTIPFEELVQSHIDSKSDVTQVHYRNKPVNIFVLSREYLIDLILKYEISPYQTVLDLVEMNDGIKINRYEHRIYTRIH